LLITLASIAVIGYFMRHPEGEDFWHRVGAPVIGTVLLLVMVYLTLDNIATLLGVEPGSTPTWVIPTTYGVVVVAGILWGLILRATRPQIYSGIGLGARSASSTSGGGFSAALAGDHHQENDYR
ncbi:MAG: amino acid permease, partial [Actinoplanes sp.]